MLLEVMLRTNPILHRLVGLIHEVIVYVGISLLLSHLFP